MGRTNPTYRDRVRHLEQQWADYRQALRRRDRPHFDRLFEHARQYADAAGYQNPTTPEVAVLVSVALAQERRIAALESRVEEGEATPESTEGGRWFSRSGGSDGE